MPTHLVFSDPVTGIVDQQVVIQQYILVSADKFSYVDRYMVSTRKDDIGTTLDTCSYACLSKPALIMLA